MRLVVLTLAACLALPAVTFAQFDDAGDGTQDSGEDRGGRRDRGDRGRDRGGDDGQGEGRFGGGFRGGFRGGPGGGFPNPLFEALDADGDQIISSPEMRRAAAALQKLDKNNDGRITQDELQPDPNQMADRMFDNADQNGDGQITPDEAQGPMSFMLRDADEDGNGAISREEYQKAMESMRQRFQGGPGGGPGGSGGGPGGPGGFGGGGFEGGGTNSIMQNDRNGDGRLQPDEVPPQMMGLLRGGDTNDDGAIDARELGELMRRRGGGDNGGRDFGGRFGRGGDRGGSNGNGGR